MYRKIQCKGSGTNLMERPANSDASTAVVSSIPLAYSLANIGIRSLKKGN